MEPRPYPYPPADKKYAFQVKWDGVRLLAYVTRNGVRLQNRHLKDKTAQYPELANLGSFLFRREAILDGELVVLTKEGKPSFARIIRRDNATEPALIKHLSRVIPVSYVLFDILYLDQQDLRSLPWHKRQEILYQVVRPHEHLHLAENFTDGVALFTATRELQLEGIVAKDKGSPYISGKKSSLWLKIKHRRSLTALVGGYTVKGNNLSSLLLGVYSEGRLRYIGRAGSGLGEEERRLLETSLPQLAVPFSPFMNPPRLKGLKVVWVKPILSVLIEFSEWTENLLLRAPVIKGFTSIPPEECVL